MLQFVLAISQELAVVGWEEAGVCKVTPGQTFEVKQSNMSKLPQFLPRSVGDRCRPSGLVDAQLMVAGFRKMLKGISDGEFLTDTRHGQHRLGERSS